MSFQKLNSLRSDISRGVAYSITTVILLLASAGFCQNASAQSMQPRPVARLISGPISVAGYSRPRRVNPEGESSAATTAVNTGGRISPSFTSASAIERRAFEQTNRARVQNGLGPLAWDSELCRMARIHSERMGKQGFFSHETPDGMQLKERARANGIVHFRVIAENIAYNKGYDDPGAFAVER
jgi:uncharacterized protein YkwD